MAWAGGLSSLGGGLTHDSTPHDSTQGLAEQKYTVCQLLLTGTDKHNFTFYRARYDLLHNSLLSQEHIQHLQYFESGL